MEGSRVDSAIWPIEMKAAILLPSSLGASIRQHYVSGSVRDDDAHEAFVVFVLVVAEVAHEDVEHHTFRKRKVVFGSS